VRARPLGREFTVAQRPAGRAAQVSNMNDQRPTSAPAARDVAAAWLLCVLLAALALGVICTRFCRRPLQWPQQPRLAGRPQDQFASCQRTQRRKGSRQRDCVTSPLRHRIHSTSIGAADCPSMLRMTTRSPVGVLIGRSIDSRSSGVTAPARRRKRHASPAAIDGSLAQRR
jgi:hypothetical protein